MEPANIQQGEFITEAATLLASNAYWDGTSYERKGRNRFLYRLRGSYWLLDMSIVVGEPSVVVNRIDRAKAIEVYVYDLSEHFMEYAEAFDL